MTAPTGPAGGVLDGEYPDPVLDPIIAGEALELDAGQTTLNASGALILTPTASSRNVAKRGSAVATGLTLLETQTTVALDMVTGAGPPVIPAGTPGIWADDEGNFGAGSKNLIKHGDQISDNWDFTKAAPDFLYRSRAKRIYSRSLVLAEVDDSVDLLVCRLGDGNNYPYGADGTAEGFTGLRSGRGTGGLRFGGTVTPQGGTPGVTTGAFLHSFQAQVYGQTSEDWIQTGASAYNQGMHLVFQTTPTGSSSPQDTLRLNATNGKLELGANFDVNWFRDSGDVMRTNDQLHVDLGVLVPAGSNPAYDAQQVAGNTVLRNKLSATDSQRAFAILGDGRILWGQGGSAATDIVLKRAAPQQLRVDQQFIAADGLATKPVAGAVSDASFAVTPVSGMLAIDTTNNKLYARIGSSWKSVSLT